MTSQIRTLWERLTVLVDERTQGRVYSNCNGQHSEDAKEADSYGRLRAAGLQQAIPCDGNVSANAVRIDPGDR